MLSDKCLYGTVKFQCIPANDTNNVLWLSLPFMHLIVALTTALGKQALFFSFACHALCPVLLYSFVNTDALFFSVLQVPFSCLLQLLWAQASTPCPSMVALCCLACSSCTTHSESSKLQRFTLPTLLNPMTLSTCK